MRVTANAFNDSLISQLNALTARQYHLQSQVSSGLRFSAPSDDPAAMENALNLQADKAAQTQYSGNITTLQTRATSVYNVLQSLQTISSRVGELATLGADNTKSQSERNNYANEVKQLIQQAAQVANTKDPATGQYLFGGTASGAAPFTVVTDANDNVTGVTYQGNASVNKVEIAAGVTVSVDIPGANTAGSGARGLITDNQSGADFFSHLVSFQNNLASGNTTAIAATDSVNLQKDEGNLLYHVSNNGVMQSRLNAAATFAANHSQSLDTMISNTSGADLVQTIVQLNQAQTAYQAALQSGSKIMQLSLLNYIQ
jgi:flagellar hook-associated protein 3 FlgL